MTPPVFFTLLLRYNKHFSHILPKLKNNFALNQQKKLYLCGAKNQGIFLFAKNQKQS